jgi:hypothetical protein
VQVLPKPIHEDAKAVEFSHRMGDLAGNLNIRGEVRCDLMLVPRTNMEWLLPDREGRRQFAPGRSAKEVHKE